MSREKSDNYNISPVLSAGDFVKDKKCLRFSSQDTLYEIVNEMRKNHSYTALVMENNDLTGLLTEHDILLYLLSRLSTPVHSQERVSKAFNILKADDVMIKYPVSIDAEMSIDDAFDELMESGYRYMPVLGDDPVGILDRTEVTQYIQIKTRKELESKDMMLSYLMHHENYGCV